MALARLTRKIRFSAAHRYYRPDWSEDENRRVFGACANPVGHGHNYLLEVSVESPVDPTTGFSADLERLDAVLREHVLAPLDHQHLNHAIPDFAPGKAIPTSENILLYLWPRLEAALPAPMRLRRLRLHEDDTFYVDYSGPDGFSE
ncbi:MAG: 6-carboxytetrahydropterin synthase [Gemmatimonadetes bacterium]|nr:6-carboxytetrahydropterin synthase [Gemmatimonadota bacterium]